MDRFKKLLFRVCRKAKVKIGHYNDYVDEDNTLFISLLVGYTEKMSTGQTQLLI